MAAEKTAVMVLTVDLQCPSCYKKIKKLLTKLPQITSQVYEEKENKVTITVVCYSPEDIRDKLYYKGRKFIKNIDIKEPPKPPEEPDKPNPEKPKETPTPPPPPPPQPERVKMMPPPPPPEMIPAYGFRQPVPTGYYYDGFPGGHSYYGGGYGRVVGPPPPMYDYNYGRSYYVGRRDYFCEENPQTCSIM